MRRRWNIVKYPESDAEDYKMHSADFGKTYFPVHGYQKTVPALSCRKRRRNSRSHSGDVQLRRVADPPQPKFHH